jgi:outer membrane receptor for ferrienterochelin and colicin
MRFLVTCLALCICFGFSSFAQEQKKDYSQLSREEIINMSYDELLAIPLGDLMKLAENLGVSVDDLLKMKITISSKSALTPRESPGIVSVVTADEIRNSGARDLIDILNLVPGFHFGYDLDGVIGIASRGNWGHEGKILILLDGQEMNENFYSTYQFGNRIPVGQIKRIEIIRGPGSSIYGGYAELGVINIITKDAKDINGVCAGASSAMMSGGVSRNEAEMAAGQKIDDFEYTVSGYYSKGNRSNEVYENFYGYSYDMKGDPGIIEGKYVNASLKYSNLNMRFLYNNFKTQEFDYNAMPFNYFSGYYGEIKYDLKCSEKLTITPKINFKEQEPWQMSYTDPDTVDSYYYHKRNIRTVGNITAQYQPTDKIDLISGIEFLTDNAKNLLSDSSFFGNGRYDISYNNLAVYLQCMVKTSFVNISVGGRFDRHNKFGNNFAPRLGLTKVINKFHFKILYSNAFRTPAIENVNINPDIKPEITTVAEMEAGYQINKNMFITANIFNIYIKNPIVYAIDSADNDLYPNFVSTGTRGFEIEYRFVKHKGSITANYSFYKAVNNKVDLYDVPDNSNYLLGFPTHKASINASYKLANDLNISPTFIFTGNRYAYVLNSAKEPELKKKKPLLTLNLFLNYENVIIDRLNLGFGIYDLLNQGRDFIEPYGNFYPPLPGYNREFLVKLNYRFEL